MTSEPAKCAEMADLPAELEKIAETLRHGGYCNPPHPQIETLHKAAQALRASKVPQRIGHRISALEKMIKHIRSVNIDAPWVCHMPGCPWGYEDKWAEGDGGTPEGACTCPM